MLTSCHWVETSLRYYRLRCGAPGHHDIERDFTIEKRMQDLTRNEPSTPTYRRQLLGAAAALPLLALPFAKAHAQFRVEVSGVGLTQFPFSIVAFRGNDAASEDMAAIVKADLERSGQFRFVPAVQDGLDETSRIDLTPWRSKGADSLITGSVTRLADGRFDVRFRLWDVARGQDLGGLSYPVGAQGQRLAAHRIADYVFEKLTGEKGVFSTRIAYVTKAGQRFDLWVADADGEGARSALSSPEPIISPSWAPGGSQLAYVSFEARKPVIYAHDVATGKRRLLANFKGSNSAPSWSPDGKQLVVTLSLSGNTQIYLMNADGGEPRRLSQTASIDTEPVFSADGKELFFVSDRGGSPQIYRMAAVGGGAQRVTFTGNYNISPAPSPDGKSLAFISRINGAFRLHVMDLATGKAAVISDTGADESPSFAPNSRMIIYATRDKGQDALMTTSVDGRIKSRLAGAKGDLREPEWGPFQR